MFNIQGHKTIIKDLHKVVNNKFVLFNDGENDLIYTGTNPYGNRLLCCIMFDDDEEEFIRYSNILITEKQYSEFLNKESTLRQIMEFNESLIVVDYNYSMEEIDHYLVNINELPNEFLPFENSFCPDFIYEPSFGYSVSMQGGIADAHKISSESLNSVSSAFSNFLKSSTQFINELELGRNVFVEALQTGSFKIKFKIDILEPQQIPLLSVSNEEINEYLNSYFHYVFNDLQHEEIDVFQHEEIESEPFKKLENKLQELYDKKGITPEAGVEHKLIDLINYSVENLKKVDYAEGFERLQFMNISANGDDIPFATIDNQLINSLDERLFDISEFHAGDEIAIDENPIQYRFQVYQFNANSGNGGAYFIINDVVKKIKVYAKGRDHYYNTSFTRSMNDEQPEDFMGIGKYVNGELKTITVNLE